jgi:hypothetical protein
MPWAPQWVVLVASPATSAAKWLGTGTLVASRRILTARHVVLGEDGQPKPGLAVRLEGSTEFTPATLQWAGPNDLDVALLETALEHEALPHPLLLLSAREIRSGEEWESQGYPAVRDGKPSERLEKVRGKACSYRKGEAQLHIDVGASPDKFNGLSGAAVVIGDHVAGVVRAVPSHWDGKRLEATPVGSFLDDEGFRKALGLGVEDDKLAKDIRELEAQVLNQVEGLATSVAAALAGELGLTCAPGETARSITNALIHDKTGKQVVMALNTLDEGLKDDPSRSGDRRVIKALLWQILPFATDWRPWVLSGRAAVAQGPPKFVDLPLGTLTMAEAVIAGIDCRSCRFQADSPMGPFGGALIRKPAVHDAAFLDPDGRRFAEATAGLLAVEFFGLAPDDRRLRNYARVRRDVNEKLHYFCEAAGDERVPRWLLLDDDPLGGAGTVVVVAALGKELPHLRVLRMGEGIDGETNLALHIGRMWRKGI